jgi:hypothetical protein
VEVALFVPHSHFGTGDVSADSPFVRFALNKNGRIITSPIKLSGFLCFANPDRYLDTSGKGKPLAAEILANGVLKFIADVRIAESAQPFKILLSIGATG